ncbi:MAG: peptide-binding protein [Nitrospinota bacterium]
MKLNKLVVSSLLLFFVIVIFVYYLASQPVDNNEASKLRHQNRLVVASIGDASNLIPYLSGDSASSEIQSYLYSSLLDIDKDKNLIPGLATSWEISDDSKSITFNLRDDVKWHDGVGFSAYDIEFQYKTMIDPDLLSAYKEPFLQIEELRVIDDFTFTVKYDQPYAPAITNLASLTGLPRHLFKDIDPADIASSKFGRNPIGNGPYQFKLWKTQEKVVVTKNSNYHKQPKPYIDEVITVVIPDNTTQFLELKSGSIDMMNLDPIQYQHESNSSYFNENFVKYKYLDNSYTYLGFNLKHELFKDKKVRQALATAIDKEEIIKIALLGLGQAATGPYKPGTWAYNDQVKRYPFNQDKATKILAEAGWRDSDNDGILDKNGKKFSFTIVTNQGNNQRKKIAQIIQQRLQDIKIDVKIKVIEWSSFLENFINKRDFEAVVLGWSLGLDPDGYIIWHSSKTKEHEFNFISYANQEVDQLLELGRRTLNQSKRKEIYHKLQKILAEEQPYIFLYYPYATPIVASKVRGIEPGAAGIAYNFDDWKIDTTISK